MYFCIAMEQSHVLQLAHAPLPMVRIGFIGLGNRGMATLRRYLVIDGIDIVALCDICPEHLSVARELLADDGRYHPHYYTAPDGWRQLCERTDLDLVYVCTDWLTHTPMSCYAMEQGKHVAIEVPAAMTLDEIWSLINTSERTRKHCMQLENCIYDFFELTALNMAQQGLFGEVLHMEGAYIHNLEEVWPKHAGNWQLLHNKDHKGVLYPTHGFGPICQVLQEYLITDIIFFPLKFPGFFH